MQYRPRHMDIRPCFFSSKCLQFHFISSVWDTKVISELCFTQHENTLELKSHLKKLVLKAKYSFQTRDNSTGKIAIKMP